MSTKITASCIKMKTGRGLLASTRRSDFGCLSLPLNAAALRHKWLCVTCGLNLADDISCATVTWMKCEVSDAECKRAPHWAAAVSWQGVCSGGSHLRLHCRLTPSDFEFYFLFCSGFSITSTEEMRTFKPVSMQTMWWAKRLNLHLKPKCSSHPNPVPLIPFDPFPFVRYQVGAAGAAWLLWASRQGGRDPRQRPGVGQTLPAARGVRPLLPQWVGGLERTGVGAQGQRIAQVGPEKEAITKKLQLCYWLIWLYAKPTETNPNPSFWTCIV